MLYELKAWKWSHITASYLLLKSGKMPYSQHLQKQSTLEMPYSLTCVGFAEKHGFAERFRKRRW